MWCKLRRIQSADIFINNRDVQLCWSALIVFAQFAILSKFLWCCKLRKRKKNSVTTLWQCQNGLQITQYTAFTGARSINTVIAGAVVISVRDENCRVFLDNQTVPNLLFALFTTNSLFCFFSPEMSWIEIISKCKLLLWLEDEIKIIKFTIKLSPIC